MPLVSAAEATRTLRVGTLVLNNDFRHPVLLAREAAAVGHNVYTCVRMEAGMGANVVEVGVREFRDELARYLESETPLAITRHGRTVGYYIPARASRDEEELDGLRRTVERLEILLGEHGVSVEEVLREFRAQRARR